MDYQPPTDRQLEVLRELLDPVWWPELATISRGHAGRLISTVRGEWRPKPATKPQARFLKQRGAWTEGMTAGEAAERIAALRGGSATAPTTHQAISPDD